MKKELVQTILNFLARVDLKGSETPTFMECIQELNKLLEPQDEKIEDKPKETVDKK